MLGTVTALREIVSRSSSASCTAGAMSPSWVVAANCAQRRVSARTHNHHRNNIFTISDSPICFFSDFSPKTEVFEARRWRRLLSQHPLCPLLAAVNWKEGGAIQLPPSHACYIPALLPHQDSMSAGHSTARRRPRTRIL